MGLTPISDSIGVILSRDAVPNLPSLTSRLFKNAQATTVAYAFNAKILQPMWAVYVASPRFHMHHIYLRRIFAPDAPTFLLHIIRFKSTRCENMIKQFVTRRKHKSTSFPQAAIQHVRGIILMCKVYLDTRFCNLTQIHQTCMLRMQHIDRASLVDYENAYILNMSRPLQWRKGIQFPWNHSVR